MNNLFSAERGLALFELLIIIVLIAMLALASYLGFRISLQKSRDSVRKSNLEEAKGVLYDYFMDNDCFPPELPECGEALSSGNLVYLQNFPCDSSGAKYGYQVAEGDCSQWFKLLTNLENEQDAGIEKVGCDFGCGPNCEYNYGVSSSNVKVNDGCVTYYACTPSGACAEFVDPQVSQCPRVFENDPECQNMCDKREARCHDERGKKVPED